MGRFDGQNVLITGAARGLGSVIAERVASEGARIIIADIQSAADTLKSITAKGGHAGYIRCDLTNEDEVVAMAREAVKDFEGKIDILINNGGMNGYYQYVKDARLSDWQHTMQVNLFGTILVTREIIPAMTTYAGGRIVNIASNAAKRGLAVRGDDVCSKWALLGLTQTLALELAPHNVRVNAVCPGPIEGDRIEQVMERHAEMEGRSKADVRREWEMSAPMKRFVRPEEVASAVVFLCSVESSAMTGQALNVTGGFLMH